MDQRRSISQLREAVTGGTPVPLAAKVGAVVMAAGLAFDLLAHTVLHSIHDELIGAFPLQEHFAHVVVVIGMVVVLAGIVLDGVHAQRRQARQEGMARHAVR